MEIEWDYKKKKKIAISEDSGIVWEHLSSFYALLGNMSVVIVIHFMYNHF